MLDKLKKKLGIIYTAASAVVIALILAIAFAQSQREEAARRNKSFSEEFTLLEETLTNENIVQLGALRDFESRYSASVYIEDNGASVFGDKNAEWLQEIYSLASAEGIDLTPPSRTEYVGSGAYGTDTLQLSDDNLGKIVIIPIWRTNAESDRYENIGWRLLAVRESFPEYERELLIRSLIYIAIGLIGTAAMFLLNKKLLERAIRPAKEYQERQKEFISAASHELRGPLSVIRANAALVKTKDKNDSYLLGIEDECVHMSRLVSDMLALASAEGETISIKRERVCVDSLIVGLYERYLPLCENNGVSLSLEIADGFPEEIVSDNERLSQILAIFMDNALAHSGAKKIELGCEGDAKRVKLSVRDHGRGIPEELKSAIFRSFFSGDSSHSSREHFGLGLSLAERMAKLLCADIGVEETKGGGASFYVSLACK